jgi:hypothetical protein
LTTPCFSEETAQQQAIAQTYQKSTIHSLPEKHNSINGIWRFYLDSE